MRKHHPITLNNADEMHLFLFCLFAYVLQSTIIIDHYLSEEKKSTITTGHSGWKKKEEVEPHL